MSKIFAIFGTMALLCFSQTGRAANVIVVQDVKDTIAEMPTFNPEAIDAMVNLIDKIDYCSEASVQGKLVEKDDGHEIYIFSTLTPKSGDYGEYKISLKGNKSKETIELTCADHIAELDESTPPAKMLSPTITCRVEGDIKDEETVSLSMSMLKSDDYESDICWWYKTYTVESSVKDSDGDFIIDSKDNCPLDANENQKDTDANGIGDVCDNTIDSDKDGIPDATDNCPKLANPDQRDANNDGIGDACFNAGTSSGLKGKDCSLHAGAVNSASGFLLDILLLCGPLALTCLRRRRA